MLQIFKNMRVLMLSVILLFSTITFANANFNSDDYLYDTPYAYEQNQSIGFWGAGLGAAKAAINNITRQWENDEWSWVSFFIDIVNAFIDGLIKYKLG